jgi:hypothetical protein
MTGRSTRVQWCAPKQLAAGRNGRPAIWQCPGEGAPTIYTLLDRAACCVNLLERQCEWRPGRWLLPSLPLAPFPPPSTNPPLPQIFCQGNTIPSVNSASAQQQEAVTMTPLHVFPRSRTPRALQSTAPASLVEGRRASENQVSISTFA